MEITPGRIVLYRLSEVDVTAIGRRGNVHKAGDILPMIAVKVWADQSVNGQVFIDGQGTQFVNTRREGTEDGTWHWPVTKQEPKIWNIPAAPPDAISRTLNGAEIPLESTRITFSSGRSEYPGKLHTPVIAEEPLKVTIRQGDEVKDFEPITKESAAKAISEGKFVYSAIKENTDASQEEAKQDQE